MPRDLELGKWIRERHKSQAAFAKKLGVDPTRLSRWLNLSDGISADYQAAIRKLGYTGPWPAEEAEDAAAGGPAPYVTREELAELRGALKAHVEYWRTGEGKVLQRLEELAQRIEAIERRVNS
jgi:transcriptional regulator with XRE-family HTH domain